MTHSLLNRPDRIAALRQTNLLDTPPEESFDRLTRMAARLLGASTALISLVTDERQFFKSAIGLPEPLASDRVAPLSFSFCSTVVGTGEPLIVEDARRHPLLRHSPAVRELGWVSYAGVPLVIREGFVIGTLCVVDHMPRLWSERDIALLQDLAASTVTEIELRRERGFRRQAELGQKETEEQLESGFEQVGIGMALLSLDGRWLRVNRSLAELLGSAPEELLGLSAESRTHPDDIAADREAMRLLLAGESSSYTMEKRFLGPGGNPIWTLVNVSLVPAAGSQPAHFITAIYDITTRKENEADLELREERYRLLVQVSGESARTWNLRTDEMVWDRDTAAPLDYEWGLVSDTADWWYERIHPQDRERVVQSIDLALEGGGGSWTAEYRFRKSDASYAPVRDRAAIIRDAAGQSLRMLAALADLTEVTSSTRTLDQVLEALPLGLWLVDALGRITHANAVSRDIWGGVPEDLDGLSEHRAFWAETGHPLLWEEWPATRALRAGESVARKVIDVETPASGRRRLVISAVPIRGVEGEIVGAVVLTEDVTERTAREAAERQQSEQIQQSQRMDAVGRLSAGIAHDFNNLLTGILSYSDLILQELRPDDPLRSDVEQIRDAGQRAAALTRQLLAFSRRQLLHPRSVSLNLALTELEPMLRRLLGPEVALELELDPSLGNVLVDPAQVEQVFVNLTLNARDAMPEGGRFRIATSNAELGGAPFVSVQLSDTGLGIDQEIQARVFEPFFTTKQAGAGRGLGLSTVYGIVEQSGGQITLESQPGEGTTFTIYFPRYGGTEPAVGTAVQRMPQLGTETILLVEDEAAVRASVRRLLEWHGYTVLEARNGLEALRVYETYQGQIDLVLTDVLMPEMGGNELIAQLRERRPDLRVLFMSGYAESVFTGPGAVSPRTGYLEKPFTVETLMRRLREVIDAEGGEQQGA